MFCVHLVPPLPPRQEVTHPHGQFTFPLSQKQYTAISLHENTPSGHHQQNDLFVLSFSLSLPLPLVLLSPSCDLNTDNPSLNKYTGLNLSLFFLPPPQIPSILTRMEDNPPERNMEGSETGGEQRASRKQNRRNPSLTCSSKDGQQEQFPPDFTLSFPHFSSPPTFSTLFLYLPTGASSPSLPYSFFHSRLLLLFLPSSSLHFILLFFFFSSSSACLFPSPPGLSPAVLTFL